MQVYVTEITGFKIRRVCFFVIMHVGKFECGNKAGSHGVEGLYPEETQCIALQKKLVASSLMSLSTVAHMSSMVIIGRKGKVITI